MTIEIHVDVPAPRCALAVPSNRLRIVNLLHRSITVELGAFRADRAPGEEATSPPLGEFLASGGVHIIQGDAYGGGGAGEVWLRDQRVTPAPTR